MRARHRLLLQWVSAVALLGVQLGCNSRDYSLFVEPVSSAPLASNSPLCSVLYLTNKARSSKVQYTTNNTTYNKGDRRNMDLESVDFLYQVFDSATQVPQAKQTTQLPALLYGQTGNLDVQFAGGSQGALSNPYFTATVTAWTGKENASGRVYTQMQISPQSTPLGQGKCGKIYFYVVIGSFDTETKSEIPSAAQLNLTSTFDVSHSVRSAMIAENPSLSADDFLGASIRKEWEMRTQAAMSEIKRGLDGVGRDIQAEMTRGIPVTEQVRAVVDSAYNGNSVVGQWAGSKARTMISGHADLGHFPGLSTAVVRHVERALK